MDDRTRDRSFAACGILVVALIVASIVVAGSPPASDARIEKIVSYYTDNRTQLLVSSYLNGLASSW